MHRTGTGRLFARLVGLLPELADTGMVPRAPACLDVALEASFQAVVLHGEAFVTAFYERLFTRYPETRAFFAATDMLEQRKKLQRSLALIVEHLRDPDSLAHMLKDLGRRHVVHGIRPEHYPLVGAILLETFADFLGSHWTQAHHDAWTKGYEAVSSLMLQGAQEE